VITTNQSEIGTDSAGDALAAIQTTRRRSAELRGYARAGDHLIAWGLVWLVGNLTAQFAPAEANWAWMIGIAAAVLFQFFHSRGRTDWRVLATVAGALGFYALAVAIVGIAPSLQPAFGSLVVAGIYVGMGIWVGPRFAWLGMVIAAVIVLGRFAFPAWLPLSLGLGGGGALIVSGLWLRQA
jgi:hypothetical protein